MEETELVMVPVFRRDLVKVYEFIAMLHQEAPPPAAGSSEVVGAAGAESAWTVDELRRFLTTAGTTNVTIGKVVDALATKPGTYFSTTELEAMTGVPRNKLKGSMSALTRHIKKHYAGHGWPFVYQWGPNVGADYPAEAHYTIDEQTASAWREARGGNP